MPRSLAFHRAIVPLAERQKYFERLRMRRAHYEGANCRFWVFEEVDLPGAFLEFIEAPDPRTLRQAVAVAPDQYVEAARVYEEVELK